MREIIFDTETTGLDKNTDRVIEIGAVELENRFPTGRTFHVYINPQGQAIHPDAERVHGISADFLADKPNFEAIIQDFEAFIDGATVVAHNASFDMGFLDAEYGRVGQPLIDPARVVDSLAIARRRHPLGQNSLDALCRRFGIDNSHRTKHGALLDSELLAEVYIELVTGRQATLGLDQDSGNDETQSSEQKNETTQRERPQRAAPLPTRLSAEQSENHQKMVTKLGDNAIWSHWESATKTKH